jgi:hypothetical protein
MRRRWITCWKRRFPSRLVHLIMSNAAVIRALDERIAVLERELLAAKKQRNALVLAASLPFEVLADILRHTQHPDGLKNARLPSLGYDRKWARTMLVCSLWRDVAIQTPVLWTIIGSKRPPWIELCSQRCHGRPLHLDGYNQHIQQLLARAQSLDVFRDLAQDQDINTALNSAAPRMEALRVAFKFGNDERWMPPVTIGPSFLLGVPASLAHLTLNGRTIQMEDAPPMPSLRVLELQYADTSYPCLINLWKQAPMIDTLHLEDPHIRTGASALNLTKISLPRLRTLIITASTPDVCCLLKILPLPSSVFRLMSTTQNGFSASASEAEQIYEACETFLSRLPVTYTGSIHCMLPPYAAIRFGTVATTTFEHVHDLADHTFSCYVNYLRRPTASHPFLARIETMEFGPSENRLAPDDTENMWGAELLPGLRALMVEYCGIDNLRKLRPIKPWLQSFQGKIKQVQFIGCDSFVRPLSEELEREGVVPSISWRDNR